MAMNARAHVVKVTGVSDELLRLFDERVRELHYAGRAEYVRELIRRDLLAGNGFRASPNRSQAVRNAQAVFARIEERGRLGVEPLSPGADSRAAIYADQPLAAQREGSDRF